MATDQRQEETSPLPDYDDEAALDGGRHNTVDFFLG